MLLTFFSRVFQRHKVKRIKATKGSKKQNTEKPFTNEEIKMANQMEE